MIMNSQFQTDGHSTFEYILASTSRLQILVAKLLRIAALSK